MANVKYGQVGWDEADVSTQKDFMDLVEGSNVVRIFTKPYQAIVHWVKDSSGVNRKIKCAIENCPLCKKGIKTQCRWYVGVINRTSGLPKILEISSQIFRGIKEYHDDADYGDVTQYDINIKRGPAKSNPLYHVMAKKIKPLTEDEKELVANFLERVQISKFTNPLTPDEIMQKLGGGTAVKAAAEEEEVKTSKVETVDDSEFSFGDEDQDDI